MGCEEEAPNITVGYTNENFKNSQGTIAINGIGNGKKAKEMTNLNGKETFKALINKRLHINLYFHISCFETVDKTG